MGTAAHGNLPEVVLRHPQTAVGAFTFGPAGCFSSHAPTSIFQCLGIGMGHCFRTQSRVMKAINAIIQGAPTSGPFAVR